MRDALVAVLLALACAASLRRPYLGACLWALISLGSPHSYFGYAAAGWPVATIVAGVMFVGLAITRERINPFFDATAVLTCLLMVWMTIGLPFSFVPDLNLDLWERSLKITIMLMVCIALIDNKTKLDAFIWANVIGIGFYGVKGGIFTLASGGSAIVLGPGGFTAENNALALAEVVIVPLMGYLRLQSSHPWLRRGLALAMLLTVVSALGSHSRGALLGVLAMAGYFWLKGKAKLQWGLLFVTVAVAVLAVMPDEYWARMNTIKTYDQDASSQGRINSWWTAFNIANARLTGGGFRTNISWVYALYAPNPALLLVEHSIYFQMLGEFGWIGLLLFLAIGVKAWINARALVRLGQTSGRPDLKWAADLGSMVQVSMIGYAVCGAFLSLALFDLPYNIMAIGALGLRFARQQAEQAAVLPAAEAPAALPTARPARPA